MKGLFSFIFLLAATGGVYAKAQNDSVLDCNDFKSILGFIEEQHLRFDSMPEAERIQLLKSGLSNISEAFKQLGYPMLAGQYQNPKYLARITSSKTDALSICYQ